MAKTSGPIYPGDKTVGLGDSTDQQNRSSVYDLYSNQPGNKSFNNINWLNGSYAGADIKVVAHLYKPVDTTSSLQEEKTIQAHMC